MTLAFIGSNTFVVDDVGTFGGYSSIVDKITSHTNSAGEHFECIVVGDVISGERVLAAFISEIPLGDDFNWLENAYVFIRYSDGEVKQLTVTGSDVYASCMVGESVAVYGDGCDAFAKCGALLKYIDLCDEEIYIMVREDWFGATSRKGCGFQLKGHFNGSAIDAKTPAAVGSLLRSLIGTAGVDKQPLSNSESDDSEEETLGDASVTIKVVRVPPAGGKTTLAKANPSVFADSDAMLEHFGFEASKSGCLACKESNLLDHATIAEYLRGRVLLSNFDIEWMCGTSDGFDVVQTGYDAEDYVDHITNCGRDDLLNSFSDEELMSWMDYQKDIIFTSGEFVSDDVLSSFNSN